MNRQSANYVESVGDDKHYEWQTPWHNRLWLCLTILGLGGIFFMFMLQNKVHMEDMSITLKDMDSTSVPLESCDIILNYDYSGDFSLSSDGKTVIDLRTLRPRKNFLWIYADLSTSDSTKGQSYTKVSDDYALHHDLGMRPERVMIEKTLECDLELNTVYRPILNHKMYNITGKFTAQHPFSKKYIYPNTLEDFNAYVANDTLKMHSRVQVYSKSLVKARTVKQVIPIRTEYVYKDSITGQKKLLKVEDSTKVVYMSYDDFVSKYPNDKSLKEASFVESFYSVRVNTSHGIKDKITLYDGRNPVVAANKNISCIHINRNGLHFPKAVKKEFQIRYQSPMIFDAISIEPDSRTESILSYTSPAKIQQINTEGLTLVARSVANANFQETLNFVYATLIGLIFSFFVEFSKRLYNYRRQKIYEAGWKYIPVISVIKSILLSVSNRVRKILNRKENIIEESK